MKNWIIKNKINNNVINMIQNIVVQHTRTKSSIIFKTCEYKYVPDLQHYSNIINKKHDTYYSMD